MVQPTIRQLLEQRDSFAALAAQRRRAAECRRERNDFDGARVEDAAADAYELAEDALRYLLDPNPLAL